MDRNPPHKFRGCTERKDRRRPTDMRHRVTVDRTHLVGVVGVTTGKSGRTRSRRPFGCGDEWKTDAEDPCRERATEGSPKQSETEPPPVTLVSFPLKTRMGGTGPPQTSDQQLWLSPTY